MSALPGRFGHFKAVAYVAGLVLILGGIGVVLAGISGTTAPRVLWHVIAGVGAIFFGVYWVALISILIKMEGTTARQLGEYRDMTELLGRQLARLDQIVANTDISDSAKSLVHRDRELDSLRQTIRAAVRREDWEGAMHLVDEMERRFGYREEAAQIRDEAKDAKSDAISRKLTAALHLVDEHCRRGEWALAKSEIDRLLKLLPDDPRVAPLPGRLRAMWEERKNALLAEWRSAVNRHDVDHAIEVLKDLDLYLTPEEAKELQDSARTVFKEKLLQMGVKFRFAVTERRWHDALEVGAELVREFPNTRMAQEVRERLDVLRERAKHQDARSREAEAVGAGAS